MQVIRVRGSRAARLPLIVVYVAARHRSLVLGVHAGMELLRHGNVCIGMDHLLLGC
jgi:hypothetical protein